MDCLSNLENGWSIHRLAAFACIRHEPITFAFFLNSYLNIQYINIYFFISAKLILIAKCYPHTINRFECIDLTINREISSKFNINIYIITKPDYF